MPTTNKHTNTPKQHINRALAHVHQALKYELAAHPSLGGVGVLGLDAALPKVAAFVRELRAIRQIEEETGEGGVCGCGCHEPQLYFAAVDVERCYDHIRPEGLLALLKGACCIWWFGLEGCV